MNIIASFRFLCAAFFCGLLPLSPCLAQIDLAGTWNGFINFASPTGQPDFQFTLIQNGTELSGSTVLNGAPGNIFGTVTETADPPGATIVMQMIFPGINYTLNINGYTSGGVISASTTDSLNVEGVLGAYKLIEQPPIPLTPRTQLTQPPQVMVIADVVQFTFQQFTKISLPSTRNLSKLRALALGAKVSTQYELTITGAERRRITSKRNTLTVRNLKPGNYQATYRVAAMSKGEKVFTTKKSPVASFTVN